MLQDFLNQTQNLGTHDVAKILQVSVGTVQKLVDTGVLTAWKTTGGHRRIPASSLVKYMSANNMTIEPTAKKQTIPRIVLLCNLAEHEKIEIMSAGKRLSVSFVFFDNPIQMLLNLLEIQPSLILIEEEIFKNLGGDSWISVIKENNSLIQTKIINMGKIPVDSKPRLKPRTQSINLAKEIVGSSWFLGFTTGYSYDQ